MTAKKQPGESKAGNNGMHGHGGNEGEGAANSNNNSIKNSSIQEIVNLIRSGDLIEPGGHYMLLYPNLQPFRQIYSEYAAARLPENEVIVLATQYEPIRRVRQNLAAKGVDVSKHIDDGTLFIVDAQQGYLAGDIGAFKLAQTLARRAEKEGHSRVTWICDMGSFFSFDDIDHMIDYELSLPQKFADKMKTVCCYHALNFETLPKERKETLFSHHYRTIALD